jgi:hypothetical protein
MVIAQLDLTDWPACSVKLAENDRRPSPSAAWRSAWAQITATADLNSRRCGIEVRFEHLALASFPVLTRPTMATS